MDDVVVAILAKDKALTLPLYLQCIAEQTFPKDRVHLYIRANDSTDATVEVLQDWVSEHGHLYKSVTADYSDVGGLRHYRNHEWDRQRFEVLGAIRQASVDHARRLGCHYFVADVDNFIVPDTLQTLCESGLEVVAPLLRTVNTVYANFHNLTDANGYAVMNTPEYFHLLHGTVRGFIVVNVVHCTYFLRDSVTGRVSYDDGSGRHEYVIFSEKLRADGIVQYLDNRKIYGLVGFLDDDDEPSSWGRFDHDDFSRRMSNLATFVPKSVNDGERFF